MSQVLVASCGIFVESCGILPCGSVIAEHGHSCSAANGILANQSNQGLNPRPQHCKADSSPLDRQAGPSNDKHFKKNSS